MNLFCLTCTLEGMTVLREPIYQYANQISTLKNSNTRWYGSGRTMGTTEEVGNQILHKNEQQCNK